MVAAMALRIVQVMASFDPSGGGPPVVAARLASALAQAGQQVTMAAWHTSEGWQRVQKDLARVPGAQQLQWFELPLRQSWRDSVFAGRARERLQELIPQADIVHLHGVWESELRAAAAVAFAHRVPYVVSTHGIIGPWALRQRWLKKKIALTLGIRRMLNRASFVHCLNEYERDAIQPLGLKSHVEIVPNGVSFEEIGQLPEPGAFYRDHPELNGDPFVLYFGRLHRGKGLNFIADALAILKDKHPRLRAVIAGPDAGAKDDFQKQLAATGLCNRVHLIGPVYGPGKFTAMVDALAFILPSEHECFSMAILEALACAVPVIISEESHFPEVAQAAAGFVLPRTGQAIADAIDKLASDPALRREMSQRGLQLIKQDYTWEKVARGMIAAYERAIANSTKTRGAAHRR
jgi:glycosyltransferase involved in cell wall biosynthesis